MIRLEKLTLPELCFRAVARYRNKVCFQIYRDGGVYDRLSYGEFGVRVRRFASLLKQMGIGRGDRVMILAENRPEWPIAYFGTALAGAVTVPVLTDFTPEQAGVIAEHAEVSIICYTGRTASKITKIDPAIPAIRIDELPETEQPEQKAEFDEFAGINEE
ncbi:MAG: long-chain fatty acid--CoA ligase, partial [Treponema sp.]|nr:long-chain fatty acid--CoA ligase [Treponema sp.]